MLKSKLLLNSGVWHDLSKKHVTKLEDIDKSFLRIILKSHPKVAIECLFLEVGKQPLKFEIMRNRLMYLWKILHLEEKELVHRAYQSQKCSPNKGDWIKLVEDDKGLLQITLSDDEIKNLSKTKYMKYIEKQVENYALSQLNEMKVKHEKSQYLHSTSLKTAEYLIDSRFSRSESNLLFKLRSKTLHIRMNYQNQHVNILCQICGLFPESQSHLLQCPQIVPKLKILSDEKLPDESLIYGNVDQQLKIIKIYMQVIDVRKGMLENCKPDDQVWPMCSASSECSNCSVVNCSCNGYQ